MKPHLLFAPAICVSLFAGASIAAEPAVSAKDAASVPVPDTAGASSPYAVTIYWDNDGAILKRNNAQDRHYTNGVAVTFAHQPDWVRGFADTWAFGESFDSTAAGYLVGHMVFTPDDLLATQLTRADRPYAGYLFAGVYLQRANDNVFDHAQLDLGVVGPSSNAEQFQKDIHDWFDADDPKGWNNQLHDEFTAQLYLRRKWRTDPHAFELFDAQGQHQLTPQVELAVGSVYRHISAGATWRIGYNLPDDFGPGRLTDVAAATGSTAHRHGAYGFVRAAGRIVEHNMFLEGNNYEDSHGVDAETFVGEVQLGVAAYARHKGWLFNANYSQTFVSDEFEEQDGSDAFGSLMLSAAKGF